MADASSSDWLDEDFISLAAADDLFPDTEASSSAAVTAGTSNSDQSNADVKKPRAPWALRAYQTDNHVLALHEEILDFCAWISASEEEAALRQTLIARVTDLIHSLWPHAQVMAFGSVSTNMYLPTSDVDISVHGVSAETASFRRLETALRQSDATSYLEAILHARVPIIKFTDRETAIAFDITFDVQSSGQSVEWVKAELALRPALRPLTMFLKYFLYSRNLHETYHGGVGSFAILVMALSHLQLGVGRTSEKRSVRHVDREYCLGALLVSFFQFYGKTLNYVRVGLSVRDGGSMFLKTSRDWLDPRRPFLLSIENPFETDLDVGKNSFNIMRVRKAFEWAYDTLLLSNAYESDAPTLLSRIVHVNEVIYANRPARPRTEIPTSVQTAATAVDLTKDDAVVDVNSDEPQVSPAVDNKRKKKRRSKEPIDLTVDDEDGDSSENDGQPSKRSIKRKKWADKHRFQQ